MTTPDPANTLRGLVPAEYEPLTHAEEMLLEAAESGKPRNCAHDDEDRRVIRNDLFRWLVFDREARTHIHDGGINMVRPIFRERLDLAAMRLDGGLWLLNSRFDQGLCLRDAELEALGMHGGRVTSSGSEPAIQAHRVRVRGPVFLRGELCVIGAVNLDGTMIGGDLDCVGGTFEHPEETAISATGAQITGRVFLNGGFVSKGEVDLSGAKIGSHFICSGGSFYNPEGVALNASGAQITGAVLLNGGFHAKGQVDLGNVAIGVSLVCTSGKFDRPHGTAMSANGARIDGGVFMNDGFSAKGMVDLGRATISVSLECSNGSFDHPEGMALNANGAQLSGVFLTRDFVAKGEVNFGRATIGVNLECTGGSFENPEGKALNASGAHITGNVYFDTDFKANGEVSLSGSTIKGALQCSGGSFDYTAGKALNANSAQITGSVFLGVAFMANGQVDFGGATLGANLNCTGGSFYHPDGEALRANGAHVNGRVNLDTDFEAKGEVDLRGLVVGSDLDCKGGRFVRPCGKALGLHRAKITGSVYLSEEFKAEGKIDLTSVTIGANLDCTNGTFDHPTGRAISANGARIGGAVRLRRGFSVNGRVRLSSTKMRSLELAGGRFCGNVHPIGTHKCAIDLSWAQITDGFFFICVLATGDDHEAADIDGAVLLRHARVGQIFDCADVWKDLTQAPVALDGCAYKVLDSHDGSCDVEFRKKWLASGELLGFRKERLASGELLPGPFAPQPYTQLASVMRAAGHEQEAKTILIEREERRRIRMKNLGPVERAWLRIFKHTLNYGYKPMQMLWWLAGFWLSGWITFGLGFCLGDGGFNPSLPQPYNAWVEQEGATNGVRRFPRGDFQQLATVLDGYPAFDPLIYSLDTLIPLVDLHQEKYWTPRGHLRYYLWTHIALGWIGTTLFVTGFTGVVRRE